MGGTRKCSSNFVRSKAMAQAKAAGNTRWDKSPFKNKKAKKIVKGVEEK